MANMSAVKGFKGSIKDFYFYPQNPVYFWSTWSPEIQQILEYVLFGWLWMRWL
jgi:hypothetical protein